MARNDFDCDPPIHDPQLTADLDREPELSLEEQADRDCAEAIRRGRAMAALLAKFLPV